MANNGIPVRLSEALASSARAAAAVTERSLTEQVEHWARLGAAVEAVVSHRTVTVLKTRSHDPELGARLAFAKTPGGRAHAAQLIAERDPVRHGSAAEGQRGVVDATGSPRRGSAAEAQRGVVDAKIRAKRRG
jgi:ParD-like antitoxin of type II bacterial toxin-antitoxin system